MIDLRPPRGRTARTFAVAALSAAVVLLAPVATQRAIAASCNGASHAAPTLASGRATPGTGSPSTAIRFTVRYTDSAGCSPTRIQVVVSGVGAFAMTGSGTSYQSGVTFTATRKLPAGRWAYHFTVSSGSGAGARSVTLTSVSPSRVVISKPKPKPTPKPAPKPTPRPTAKPVTKPKPNATPGPSVPPGAPSDGSHPGGTTDGGAGGSSVPSPGQVAAVVPGDRPPGHAADAPSNAYAGAPFGPTIDPVVGFAVTVWSLTSALGVLLFAAAMRRVAPREQEPAGRWRRLPSFRSGRWSAATVATNEDPASQATAAEEAYLPRWLRPSLRAERASNEQTAAYAMRDPVVFAAPPAKGAVRSTVAYRLVRVSDAPNDHTSVEIGRLDRGDEVEIVGDSEGYLKVRTPTGLEGWVPRMVLVG